MDAFDDAPVDPSPPPVVELGSGRVGVPDQVRDLFDGDVLRKQGGHDHDAEGMRRQVGGPPGDLHVLLDPLVQADPDGNLSKARITFLWVSAPHGKLAL